MIPDYQSLMRPVLDCARNEPRRISDVVEEVSNLDVLELARIEADLLTTSFALDFFEWASKLLHSAVWEKPTAKR